MKSKILSLASLLFLLPFLSEGKGGGHGFGHGCVHGGTHAVLTTSHSHSSNSLKGIASGTFPGTVVYNQDTVKGMIEYTSGLFLVNSGNTTLKIKPDDLALKSLTMQESETTLTLVRLTPRDKQLYRVIHSGKLNIYDTRADFIHDTTHMNFLTVMQNGDALPMGGLRSQRRWLVIYINLAYDARLTKDASWNELLAYLDHVN